MRYVTFEPLSGGGPCLGVLLGETVVDLARAAEKTKRGTLPDSLLGLLEAGPQAWQTARTVVESLTGESALEAWRLEAVHLRAPLPRPRSLRDFYAFEAHVRAAAAIRGRPMPADWYEMPVFYFGHAGSVIGPGAPVTAPAGSEALDFELEIAAVVGLPGRDLRPEEAEEHIFGFTILNDWSARDLQRREMSVGLGPAKGKDFATSLGPWLVTPDELVSQRTGRPGVYDAVMRARVNGVERSRGNWKEIHFSFGEMLARASADVDLSPGDVVGSGTVGGGCLLELTGGQGPWLKPGDRVELEIDGLGILENVVAARPAGRANGEVPATADLAGETQ
ncbi:MAG TPA: fumarylacetoacetate hydrolase family protein [Anaerolineales bacterium]|nr:fumarylacetoacetate hydrolase family protein [Anaerolineales bacterium]